MDPMVVAGVVGTALGTAVAAGYARITARQLAGAKDPETGEKGPDVRDLMITTLGKVEGLETQNNARHSEVMGSQASMVRRIDHIEDRLKSVEDFAKAQATLARGSAADILKGQS